MRLSIALVVVLLHVVTASAQTARMRAAEQALARISGAQHALLGMHDTLGGFQADGFDAIAQSCGVPPDLWSTDFGFSKHPNDSIDLRYRFVARARQLHARGTLVTLSWHQCNPTRDEPCSFQDGVQRPLSDAEWHDLLEAGTPLNHRWKQQMKRLAKDLRKLENENVAVLLRPYHEANIPSFWWASEDPERFKALWRQLHDYFVKDLELRNVLWVWSVSFHPRYWARVSDYYPGDDVTDIVGVDIYPPTRDGRPDFDLAAATLERIAPRKPRALTEVSRLPSREELSRHRWAYVVPWGEHLLLRDNTMTAVCELYSR